MSATATARLSQPPIIIDTRIAAMSAARTSLASSLPRFFGDIPSPPDLVMTSSPLGPLASFASYAFCSSGVGR